VVLWAAAAAWLPALMGGELARPRLVGAPGRWSTVFPLGMYAAMSFAVGELAGLDWMRAFARDWTWLAAAAWALVLLDALPAHRASTGRRAPEETRHPADERLRART
jgi:tellurite resistance protein TehA-like permease